MAVRRERVVLQIDADALAAETLNARLRRLGRQRRLGAAVILAANALILLASFAGR